MKQKFSKKLRVPGLLLMCLLAIQGFAIQSDPTVIAFDDGALGHAVYAFAESDNGTLVVNYGHHDLGSMQWADLGLPDGASWIVDPSAVTYLGPDGVQYIHVFATSDLGDLVVCHWDGSQWNWDDLTAESASYFGFGPLAFQPSAITYLDQEGNRKIRVFSSDNQQYLWVSSCDNNCITAKGSWLGLWQFYQITNQLSVGDRRGNRPMAAHFFDSNGNGVTYVFANSVDQWGSNLGTVNGFWSTDSYWSGYSYSFGDLGSPDGTSVAVGGPVALTQEPDAGVFQSYPPPCVKFHVFAVGVVDFPIYRLFDSLGCRDSFFDFYSGWGGSYWVNDGLPPQMIQQSHILDSRPSVVSYIDPSDGLSRYHVFVNDGATRELFRAFLANESGPTWFEQGFPPGPGGGLGTSNNVAFVDGVQFVYAFLTDYDTGHLVVNYCIGSDTCDGVNGQAWGWADQGTM